MKRILLLFSLLFVFAVSQGQMIGRGPAPSAPVSAARTYQDVIDDYGKFWGKVGDGSATFISLSGTDVTELIDLTGNGNTLEDWAGVTYPDYDAANGEIDFTTAGPDWLEKNVATDQPFTIIVVIRQNARTNQDQISQFNHVGGGGIQQTASDASINLYAGGYLSNSSASVGSYAIITAVINDDNSILMWNESSASGDAGPNAGTTIRVSGGTGADISFKEMIFFDAELSSDDITLMINYLNGEYTIY